MPILLLSEASPRWPHQIHESLRAQTTVIFAATHVPMSLSPLVGAMKMDLILGNVTVPRARPGPHTPPFSLSPFLPYSLFVTFPMQTKQVTSFL